MIEQYTLHDDYKVSRIIKGGWQLSAGHSPSVSIDPVKDMFAFVSHGINTFDCADIYTGVEELIGQFVLENRALEEPFPIKIHTKYVPDYDQLANLNKQKVEAIIDRSLKRLNVDQLDMVQFSWWTYDIPGWVETGHWLQQIQQEGKIDLLATTNFNTETSKEMLEAGIPVKTVQVQYSLLDPRPEKALVNLCAAHDVHLLCYGTLAGGFLTERWLRQPEPAALENRSLIKYKLMIDEVGGWAYFQELLNTLKQIADKHSVTIAAVASRYILNQPQVAAAIIGARNAAHINAYDKIFLLQLDAADNIAIENTLSQRKMPPGDVFDLERIKDGPHGRIMKYNLNAK